MRSTRVKAHLTKETAVPDIGPMELVVVLIIALVVIGPKKLPGVGRSLGKGINEFKEGISGREPADEAESDREPPALVSDDRP